MEYGRRGGLHRRENVENQCKTVQNSILAPKRPLQLKIQIFELKIWISSFLFALLTSNITYMKHLQRGRPPQTRKRRKTVQNGAKQCKTAFWRQNDRYSSKFKFWIQNLNFKPLDAVLTSNITYMKRLLGMGAGEASTDEKTAKNSEKQRKTAKNSETVSFGAKTSR